MPRVIKDWLQSYLEYTSLSESPLVFHFWTGVSTIAGALKRRVWIDQDIFQWVPNFYIVFVAPPGVAAKGTTIQIGMDLLNEVEGIHWGPNSGTWQALGKKLEEAQEMVSDNPLDIDAEFEHMSAVTCVAAEAGTFFNFQDDKFMSVITDLWDGKKTTFEHATSTQGNIMIKNPWINIIAATTPAWLKQNAPELMIGGGFASRTVFVFGKSKRHFVAYPGLARDKAQKEAHRDALVHDLKEIAKMFGEMKLSPEAVQLGMDWYEKHWSERPLHMASDRFGGYIARKQTHIHKLAMVHAAARHDYLWIEEQDLSDAIKVMTSMEADMINVFESIGMTSVSRLLFELMNFIKAYQDQGQAVSRQLLWRHCVQIMSPQEFQDVQKAGIDAGYIEIAQANGDYYYRILVDPKQINGTHHEPFPHQS